MNVEPSWVCERPKITRSYDSYRQQYAPSHSVEHGMSVLQYLIRRFRSGGYSSGQVDASAAGQICDSKWVGLRLEVNDVSTSVPHMVNNGLVRLELEVNVDKHRRGSDLDFSVEDLKIDRGGLEGGAGFGGRSDVVSEEVATVSRRLESD